MPTRKRLSAEDRREVIERAATAVFGQRGYRGATIDEIARRSGVTVPVVYDHFVSKRQLYQHLIERSYEQLRSIWLDHAGGGGPISSWIADAIDSWFTYIEQHPFAGRMLFRDTTGDPELVSAHDAILRASREELLPLVARAAPHLDAGQPHAVELAWETLRSVLQGLALWWYDHPDVPREVIVASAMDAVWIGLERVLDGETWKR